MARKRTNLDRCESLESGVDAISHRELLRPGQGGGDLRLTAPRYQEFAFRSLKRKADLATHNQIPMKPIAGQPIHQDRWNLSTDESPLTDASAADAWNTFEHFLRNGGSAPHQANPLNSARNGSAAAEHHILRPEQGNGDMRPGFEHLVYSTSCGVTLPPVNYVHRQHSVRVAEQQHVVDHRHYNQSSGFMSREEAPAARTVQKRRPDNNIHWRQPPPHLPCGPPAWEAVTAMPFNSSDSLLSKRKPAGYVGINTFHDKLSNDDNVCLEKSTDHCYQHDFLHRAITEQNVNATQTNQDFSFSVRDLAVDLRPVAQESFVGAHSRITTRDATHSNSIHNNSPKVQNPVILNSQIALPGPASASAPDPPVTHKRSPNSLGSHPAPFPHAPSSSENGSTALIRPAPNGNTRVNTCSNYETGLRHTTTPPSREKTKPSTVVDKIPPRFRNQDTNCLVCQRLVTQNQLSIANLRCTTCPRVFHGHCLTYIPPSGNQNWHCSLCYKETWHGYGHLPAERDLTDPSLVERYRRRLLLAKTYGNPNEPDTIRFWFSTDMDGSLAADQAVLVRMGMVNEYHLRRPAVVGSGSAGIDDDQPNANANTASSDGGGGGRGDGTTSNSVEVLQRWPIALGISLQEAEARSDNFQAQLNGFKVAAAEQSGKVAVLQAELERLKVLAGEKDLVIAEMARGRL